uniref:Uncharacterized protein n=1 Tax=Ciona savignyi TaxID=51511 RepID=H2YYH4_CIOSA
PASTRFKIQANQAIEIEIVSHAPKAILFQKLEISLEYTKPKADDSISVSSSMSKVSYDGETDGANYLGVSSKKTFDSASAPVSPEPRR